MTQVDRTLRERGHDMYRMKKARIPNKPHTSTQLILIQRTSLPGGRQAQWLGRRISDKGVPGSSPGRWDVRCGLEQVTFTPCLVLVKPRKRWTDNRLRQTVTRLETTLCLMC